MKSRNVAMGALLAALACASNLHAQTAPASDSVTDDTAAVVDATEYDQTVPIGAHHRRVEHIVQILDESGSLIAVTNRYVELQSGMHYLDNGQWKESKELIELFPGGAIARQGRHKVIFANNLATAGAIDLETPDGVRLRSHIAGLSYFDRSSGQSVLLAEIKDTIGLLVSSNQIVYPDAFDDIKAEVRYTYTKAGFEQDVILLEKLPDPAAFGLNPPTTQLEVLTEFLDPPIPRKRILGTVIGTNDLGQVVLDPATRDETLEFGEMTIGPGIAFLAGDDPQALPTGRLARGGFPVRKSWQKLSERDFLIEAIDHGAIGAALEKLPAPDQARARLPRREARGVAAADRVAPRRPRSGSVAAAGSSRIQVAQGRRASRGLVIDYITLSGGTNLRFAGDTTYYVSGYNTLYGTTTIEGGAVVKYTSTGALDCQGSVVCQTSPYRPAFFTAKDDDSIGETIAGSSGVPGGYYADYALSLQSSSVLQHLRVHHARAGVAWWAGPLTVRHCQITKSSNAFEPKSTSLELILHNVLIREAGFAVYYPYGHTVRAENATFSLLNFLYYDEHLQPTIYLTNCLLSAVTNSGSYSGANNSVDSSGNGLQSVGGGGAYLHTYSDLRNAGSSTINPTLLLELRALTTHPPLFLTNGIVSNRVLGPIVPRDIDTPDIGFHYEPIDFLVNNLALTNVTLTLTNGVVLANYGTYGILLHGTAKLVSEGNAVRLNRLARYRTVQENAFGVNDASWHTVDTSGSGGSPEYRLRFTALDSIPSSSGSYLLAATASPATVTARDCQFRGAGVYFNTAGQGNYQINNCLFERSRNWFSGLNVGLYNNLFWWRGVFLINQSGETYTIKDNLFDQPALIQNPIGGTLDFNHNAYISGANRLSPYGSNDVILSASPAYQAGALGAWYLPPGSALINAGSRASGAAGLFHHTTQTNQLKEGYSTVDIGYHYVSLLDALPGLAGHWALNEGAGGWAYDASANANHGALVNGPSWTSGAGAHDQAVEFDGVNDYIDLGDPANGSLDFGTGSFSYGAWVFVLSDIGASDMVLYKLDPNAYNRGYDLELGTGGWAGYISDGVIIKGASLGSGIYTQWIHLFVVVDRQAKTLTSYTNGIQSALTDITAVTGTLSNPVSARIGSATYPIRARIDDVRIYNRALSAFEVAVLASGGTYDTDGDGQPDYLEDANGNNSVDSGETDWQGATDAGLRVRITRPKEAASLP